MCVCAFPGGIRRRPLSSGVSRPKLCKYLVIASMAHLQTYACVSEAKHIKDTHNIYICVYVCGACNPLCSNAAPGPHVVASDFSARTEKSLRLGISECRVIRHNRQASNGASGSCTARSNAPIRPTADTSDRGRATCDFRASAKRRRAPKHTKSDRQVTSSRQYSNKCN